MDKLLEKHFVKKYPKIFVDMYGPMNETCMHWGIECGAGWFFLLDNLCSKIQRHIDDRNETIDKGYAQPNEKPIPQLVALQIKEKFGALRFYYSGGDEYIRTLVDFAESLSYSICENCGKFTEDVGRTQGWIQSLCTICAKEFDKEIKQRNDIVSLWKKVMLSRKNPKRSWKTIDEWTKDDVKELKKDLAEAKKRKK